MIFVGDNLPHLRAMADNSVDAIVTDPPYGLTKARPGGRTEATRGKVMGGFMGLAWDYDVPSVELWAECLRVLKPGGHLLAFAGTRTQHRMACRIEDAGFEIRDMIAWLYGSGFPKSLDVSKALDKAAGMERKVIGIAKGAGMSASMPNVGTFRDDSWVPKGPDLPITAPATEAARQWEGWGTALKPAMEPITVARKPLVGTVAANVLAHGTGALNIDACRVQTVDKLGGGNTSPTVDRTGKHDGWLRPWMEDAEAATAASERSAASVARSEELGRWPANVIHDGSEEVLAAFPQIASGDKGSAARFFYCAKASKADRDAGLDGFEETAPNHAYGDGLNTATKVRTDEQAATGVEREGRRNNHPTVKPTALMRYLCRLVTPPGGLVLDPFVGSGSTGKAAALEGFRFIGLEQDPAFAEIAKTREAHAIAAYLDGTQSNS